MACRLRGEERAEPNAMGAGSAAGAGERRNRGAGDKSGEHVLARLRRGAPPGDVVRNVRDDDARDPWHDTSLSSGSGGVKSKINGACP